MSSGGSGGIAGVGSVPEPASLALSCSRRSPRRRCGTARIAKRVTFCRAFRSCEIGGAPAHFCLPVFSAAAPTEQIRRSRNIFRNNQDSRCANSNQLVRLGILQCGSADAMTTCLTRRDDHETTEFSKAESEDRTTRSPRADGGRFDVGVGGADRHQRRGGTTGHADHQHVAHAERGDPGHCRQAAPSMAPATTSRTRSWAAPTSSCSAWPNRNTATASRRPPAPIGPAPAKSATRWRRRMTKKPNDRQLSAFIYAWGQFIDHDIDLTEPPTADGEAFNIQVPDGDDVIRSGRHRHASGSRSPARASTPSTGTSVDNPASRSTRSPPGSTAR